MITLFAWCDATTAPTGFGRSALHVLHALYETGRYRIVQLAVNLDPGDLDRIPWKVYMPTNRAGDPYGLHDLGGLLVKERPDMMWTTFDPEVPWKYMVPGTQPAARALDLLYSLKTANPGFRAIGWFPVDGGPLSDLEMAVLGSGPYFDAPVTMSPHVYDLLTWTLQLKGQTPDRAAMEKRLRVIPHGVDLAHYHIPTPEERAAAKGRLGLRPDQFVVLQLERNQQRKQNYLGLEVLECMLKRRPKLRGKVVLYQHMAPDEENHGCQLGFNLPALSWRYGLRKGIDVIWPANPHTPENRMVPDVYGAADVFLSVSTGEGFQYPAWEALACGIPLVVPDDSARSAWLSKAPNVHLYQTDRGRLVMRGGYQRRMGYPDTRDAAHIILQMVQGTGRKYSPKAEAGRAFVEEAASLSAVQQQWVDLMVEQEAELEKERRAQQVAIAGSRATHLVDMTPIPGLGDAVMAAPALRLLRKQGKVRLRVHRGYLELMRAMNVADEYEPRPTPDTTAEQEHLLSSLWHPTPPSAFMDPSVHRSDIMAQHLGLDPADLEPFRVELPPAMVKQARAHFLDSFGVDPSQAVALCLEAGDARRALPRAYLNQLVGRLKAKGLAPLVTGLNAQHIRTHGVLDLSGQTDLLSLLAVLDLVGAAICVDSSALHFAAMLGTPVVGCFTTVLPAARMRHYSGVWRAVIPEVDELDGEKFPAGHTARANWVGAIRPEDIMAALEEVMGCS